VSSDPGYYRRITNPTGGLIEDSGWGATASSLPMVGGLITLADLASGHIDHAVAVMVPMAKGNAFYFPAQRTDGGDASPAAVPEGARFRLDPTLDLSALQMSPVARMIAEAAQKYGLIVNDQTGATVGFRAEDPTPLMRSGQSKPLPEVLRQPRNGPVRGTKPIAPGFSMVAPRAARAAAKPMKERSILRAGCPSASQRTEDFGSSATLRATCPHLSSAAAAAT
jgi:hypothetical protein